MKHLGLEGVDWYFFKQMIDQSFVGFSINHNDHFTGELQDPAEAVAYFHIAADEGDVEMFSMAIRDVAVYVFMSEVRQRFDLLPCTQASHAGVPIAQGGR